MQRLKLNLCTYHLYKFQGFLKKKKTINRGRYQSQIQAVLIFITCISGCDQLECLALSVKSDL